MPTESKIRVGERKVEEPPVRNSKNGSTNSASEHLHDQLFVRELELAREICMPRSSCDLDLKHNSDSAYPSHVLIGAQIKNAACHWHLQDFYPP